MPEATFVGSARASGLGTGLTVSAPSGLQAGDHQLLIVVSGTGSDTTSVPTAGWSRLIADIEDPGTNPSDSSARFAVYTSSTTTGNVTVNSTQNRLNFAVRVAWRGGSGFLTTPAPSGALRASNSTSHTLPTQATTAADQLVIGVVGYDTGLGSSYTTSFSMPSPWVERFDDNDAGGSWERAAVGVYEARRPGAGTQSGIVTASRADYAFVFSATLAAAGPSEETKSGTDTAVTTETGGVTVASTGAETARSTDSGHVAHTGSDTGIGTEEGYVAEGRSAGETAAGTETGDTAATSASGETVTATEAGATSAAVDPPADVAAGLEAGHIAIPGGDTARAGETLQSLRATVTTGEQAIASDGGYVETLYGDLIVNLYAVDQTNGQLVALPDYTQLDLSRERNSAGSISLDYPPEGKNFELLRDTVTGDRDLEIELWTNGTPTGALRGYLQEASGDDVTETGVWRFAGGFLELRMGEAIVWPQPIIEYPPAAWDAAGLILQRMQDNEPINSDWTWSGAPPVVGQFNDALLAAYADDDSPEDVKTWLRTYISENTPPGNDKRELIFATASPGTIGRTIMAQAHERGTLTDVAVDFTSVVDSTGRAWPKVASPKFSPGSTHTQVLDWLVERGMAEWTLEWTGAQRVLRMWIPEGRGDDRTTGPRPVVLRRGRNLLDAPRKWSVRESGTAVLAAGGEGIYQDASDATARARRGRRIETYTSAGNFEDEGSVLAYAQAQLGTVTPGLMEVTHGIGMLPGEPRPIIAFNVGDWVYSQTSTTTERLRVVQWTLQLDEQRQLSGTVTLNDTVRNALERMQRRLNAIQAGETVVGTSESSAPDDDTIAPAAPTGLVATSEAYYDVEGTGYAAIFASWNETTHNVDGSIADDVAGYQVRWRYNDVPTYPAGWNELPALPSATSRDWAPVAVDVDVQVQVCAYDRSNNFGPWSDGYIFHTAVDDTPPPTASAPAVDEFLSVLRITWDGLGSEGEEMPRDLRWVEVHVSTASNFTPSDATLHDYLYGAGTAVYVGGQYGVTYFARLVAVDKTGNRSEPSAQGSAIPEQLVSQDLIDSIITAPKIADFAVDTAKIVNGAIVNAKIADLAVNDAKIQNLSVGKLQTGQLNADVTIAGRLMTAASGARWMADSAGMRLYNPSNELTVDFRAATGQAFVSGQFQTRPEGAGTRMVMNPGGNNPDELRFYPNSGERYAKIETRTFNNQALIDGIGGSTRSDNASGQFGAHPLEGYIRWGQPESTRPNSLVVARQQGVDVEGPYIQIAAWEGVSPPSGLGNEVHFVTKRSNGEIRPESRLIYRMNHSNHPLLLAPNAGAGVTFQGASGAYRSTIGVVNGELDMTRIIATNVDISSSQEQKEDIRDARALVNPLKVIQNARAKAWKYSHERPESPGEPDAPDVIGVIAEELPPPLQVPMKLPNGTETIGVGLVDLVGTLWGALNQIQDQEIVSTSAVAVLDASGFFPPGVFPAGATAEVEVTWDSAPPAAPTGGFAQIASSFVWAGRATAWVKTGSTTETGCTVVFKNISGSAFPTNPNNDNSRVVANVIGLGLYTPPFEPED